MQIVKTNTGEYGRISAIKGDYVEVTYFNGKASLHRKDRVIYLVEEKRAKTEARLEIGVKLNKLHTKYQEEAKRVEGRNSDVAIVQKAILDRVVNDLDGVLG